MRTFKKGGIIFSIGAFGYGLIEIIWRGYTHWSMLLAGGVSLLGLSVIAKRMKNTGLVLKGVAGSVMITATELIFGIVFNVLLKKNVWDYSRMPLNLGGQVCILYSFFWFLLSLIFVPLAGKLEQKIQ